MQLPYRFGRYVLIHKIAIGGMAEIYRAKYIGEGGFEKTVAIKRLLPTWSSNKEFITMLIDEARAQVNLQHPNIVQVIELGKEQESYFLSMELVEGLDLGRFFNKIIRGNINLSLKFIIYIIGQILQALHFAHQQMGPNGTSLNLVHRDISPPNVLLSWNGEVKVADFGIAKGTHRTHQTVVAQVKGKYSYMSPEQARGETIDQRTDIYATGILFYELLARQRLFDAPQDLEVIELVKKSKIPKKPLGNADSELKKILVKALKSNADERYQTAHEFLEDLNRYATQRNLITQTFEFGRFLKETFPEEAARNEEESKSATEIFKKTQVFGSSKITPARSVRIKQFLRLQGSMAAIFLICIFLPGSSKLNLTLPASPQLAITPATISSEAAKEIKKAADQLDEEARAPVAEKGPAVINVQARPWGYVTIPGYINRRETPVHNLKLKSGNHLVKVYYAPTNQWTQKAVLAQGGKTTNCLATFGKNPSLKCR